MHALNTLGEFQKSQKHESHASKFEQGEGSESQGTYARTCWLGCSRLELSLRSRSWTSCNMYIKKAKLVFTPLPRLQADNTRRFLLRNYYLSRGLRVGWPKSARFTWHLAFDLACRRTLHALCSLVICIGIQWELVVIVPFWIRRWLTTPLIPGGYPLYTQIALKVWPSRRSTTSRNQLRTSRATLHLLLDWISYPSRSIRVAAGTGHQNILLKTTFRKIKPQ